MYPVNPEKLTAAAPELLALLNEAKYTIDDMSLLIPEGKGNPEHYKELFQKIVHTISKVYDKWVLQKKINLVA